jgi:hypothetical protein
VDADILIVSDFLKWIESAKGAVGAHFRMKNFGEAKIILGMDIMKKREAGTDSLSHDKEILEKYGVSDNTPFKVPMVSMYYRDGEVASDHD